MTKRRHRLDGRRLTRGYYARCSACGEVVVHAASTGEPFHVHRGSERCRRAAEARRS